MATKTKKCQICQARFQGRRDAKTCSPTCRKRLQRSTRATPAAIPVNSAIEAPETIQDKAVRLESALGLQLQNLAAQLLPQQAALVPVLADERGSIPVLDESSEEAVTVHRPSEVIEPSVAVKTKKPEADLSSLASNWDDDGHGDDKPPTEEDTKDTGPVNRRLKLAMAGLLLLILLLSGALFAFTNHQGDQQAKNLADAQTQQQQERKEDHKQSTFNYLTANKFKTGAVTTGDLTVTGNSNIGGTLNAGDLTVNSLTANIGHITNLTTDNFNIGGAVNTTNVYQINGNTICNIDGCAPAAGSNHYIQNGTGAQTADFNITGNGTIGGDTSVGGNANVAGSTTVGGNITGAGTLTVPTGVFDILAIQGANGLTLGAAGTSNGGIVFQNGSNANTVTLQAGTTGSNLTFTLPTADGSGGQCLQTNGNGALSFQNCSSGAAGVTSINGLSGVLTLQGTASQVTVTPSGGNTFTLSLPQSIATTSSPTFGGLTVNGTLSATTLQGNGSAITALNASNISSGTLADGRLSANVALYNATTANFTGTLQHNGSNVCDISNNCSYAPASGSGNYIRNGTSAQTADFNITGTASAGTFSGSGASLTNLDASQLASGTVLSARVSGSYTGITGVGALAAGSIASGFGTISTGNNITTTATVQGGAVNATSAIQLGGASINTGGTLSNVAYLDQSNNFTGTNLQHSGNTVCDASNNCSYAPATGSGNYINNTTSPQTANFNITGTGTVGGILSANATGKTAITIADSGAQLSGLTIGGDTNLYRASTGVLQTDGQLSLGKASTTVGQLNFFGSGSANSIALKGPTSPGSGLALTLPNEAGTLCSTGSVCTGYAAASGSGNYIQNGTSAQTADFNITGSGTVGGTLIAASLQGAGSGITALNASNISSGTLADGRLSANVALYNNATSNFTGTLQRNGNTVCDASNNCSYAPATGSGNYINNTTSPQTADFNVTGTGQVGGILTAGAGGKTAIQIADSGAQNSGITIGGDTNLYRSAADTLKTDDSFVASGFYAGNTPSGAGDLLNVGISTRFLKVGSGRDTTIRFDDNSVGTGPLKLQNLDSSSTSGVNIRSDLSYDGSTAIQGSAIRTIKEQLWTSTASTQDSSLIFLTTQNGSSIEGGRFTSAQQLQLPGTGSTAGLLIGGDTNLYQSAASTLSTGTDDNLVVQGGSLTVGIAGTTAGSLVLANASSSRTVILQGLNPSGSGNATIQIPTIAGGSTDTVCLLTLANCGGGGGGVTTVGTIDSQTKSANGAVISGSSIYLQNADATNVGLVSTGTQTFAGYKTLSSALTLNGGAAGVTNFTTPQGSSVGTTINIPIYSPGAFGQILAFGLPNSAPSTSRAISVFDDRTAGAQQPAIALFNPAENDLFGLSWEGSDSQAYLKTLTAGITLRVGSADALTIAAGGNLTVGTSDTTGTLLVLDTKTGSGDPTGVNGGMYYNSNAGKFRCYQASAWTDCIGSGGGGGGVSSLNTLTGDLVIQGAANQISVNTSTPNITLGLPNSVVFDSGAVSLATTGANGFTLKPGTDNASAFAVQNAAGTTSLFKVDTSSNLVYLVNAPVTGGVIIGSYADASGTFTQSIAIGANLVNNTGASIGINLGSLAGSSSVTNIRGGTGASAVTIRAGSGGGILIGDNANNTLTLGSTGSTSTITLGRSTAGETVNIANGTVAAGATNTINIGTDGTSTGKNVVKVGATNGASVLTLQSGTGGTVFHSGGGASGYLFQNTSTSTVVTISTANITGTPNAAAAAMKVTQDSGTGRSINASGTVNASGADYAEYIPWSGPKPAQGSVVTYNGSTYVVSSPTTAGFVGNDNFGEDSILVTFAGQVPVRVTGAVSVGDILIDNGDGTARAVNPSTASLAQLFGKLGIAQEASSGGGAVKAAIGTTSSNLASSLQSGGSGDFTDLNVSGTSTLANLTVTGAATVGSLSVTGSAEFAGNITVNGNLVLGPSAKVLGNASTRGDVTVSAGQTTASYSFPSAYGSVPNVVATPTSDPGGAYWVSNVTEHGFTVHLSAPVAADLKFNFQAQQ